MIDHYQTQSSQYLLNTYARYPITLVRGEGAYVWDIQGRKYLDFLSGIACTPLGHCHPAVIEAVVQQTKTLFHTSNLYHSPPSIELAKLLIENGGLDKVFFCNSGAEANEAAIKLARKYQFRLGKKNKHSILSAHHSFHGRTLGALSATAKPGIQEGFAPLGAGFRYADAQDIDAFCQAIESDIAAVILEPIQGEGGIQPLSKKFLEAVRAKCDAMQALLIFDEVQCGIGRTGNLFAYQYFGVKPDIITLAKGIANGLPLGAVCAINSVADAFQPGDHGSTFGGNPIVCAAALATLQTLLNQNYLLRVKQLSEYLFEQLRRLQQEFPKSIKSIRGAGLMIGIELGVDSKLMLAECQKAGLLVNITADTILRLLPSYVITEAEIINSVSIISTAVEYLELRAT